MLRKYYSIVTSKILCFSSLVAAICALGLLPINSALATEVHSDVEYEIVDGKIEFELPEPGLFVFEGDFNSPEIDDQPNGKTEDPGFDNEEFPLSSRLANGSFLGFNILGPLSYWDGTQFLDPGSATITIDDNGFPSTASVISSSTVSDLAGYLSGMEENIIGQAGIDGVVHEHVDFTLNNGLTGAYGLLMSLTTDQSGIMDSHTFGLFFNNGLSEELFEAGVDAFNSTVVPIPAGIWLFLSAIAGLMFNRTRIAKS